jgi:hypothetical protein
MEYVRQVVECGGRLYEEYGYDAELDEPPCDLEKEREIDAFLQARANLILRAKADGEKGLEPVEPEDPCYWSYYCSALRQFYLSRQGKTLTPGDPIKVFCAFYLLALSSRSGRVPQASRRSHRIKDVNYHDVQISW